jgi:hypothetical protein
MRVLMAAALAVSLSATNLTAADVTSPLPPGHAAGAKKAQETEDILWRLTMGAAIIGIIGFAALKQSATSTTATTS